MSGMAAEGKLRYWIGIDVGTHSLGTAAISVDETGRPIELLNCMVRVHDSGLDPAKIKTATTRLASSGLARRTRRLVRRRRARLLELDQLLLGWGWQLIRDNVDPYEPWRARAELAAGRISESGLQTKYLSVAVRHMARHRGWRNPYSRVESLLSASTPSEQFEAFRDRVAARVGTELVKDATVGQLVAASAMNPETKLRGDDGLLGTKLLQSDNANELIKIAEIQGLPKEMVDQLVRAVFKAESPRGAAAKRVGRDPLPDQRKLPRASKGSDAFQRFRIVSILANLRIRSAGRAARVLSVEERQSVLDYLINVKPSGDPSWVDVADVLKIRREDLTGTATTTADGDRASARPPVHATDRIFRATKVKTLAQWWPSADHESRDALVELLSNSGSPSDESAGAAEAQELVRLLGEDELTLLDTLHIPAGRAAYSEDSLRRMTARMLASEDDVHSARIHEFGVDDSWGPPADPIGAPVGNPAVDRVLKALARWLAAVEAEWGPPEKVVIEHVRSAFASENIAREQDRANNRRYEQNLKLMDEIRTNVGVSGEVRRSDVTRFQAITRQNGQCLYCGSTITFATAEMDHIVPRAGQGSTNQRNNLAAVCSRCNKSKTNTLFAVWARSSNIPGVSLEDVINRVNFWLAEPGQSKKDHSKFLREVRLRLERTAEDPEIDARSMESVAWMANELRIRVDQHFRVQGADTKVSVYRGRLTKEARFSSGIEGRIPFIGGGGKTRLDRRHHAIDAAVISMMDESIARTLAERTNQRDAQHLTREPESWKSYAGSSPQAISRFQDWKSRMHSLADLLCEAMDEDRIPVTENLRLRLGDGAAHLDTIQPLVRLRVSDEISSQMIDRASTPALWSALTAHPDFEQGVGLPACENRSIKLHGRPLTSIDEIGFFAKDAAAIAVRGGFAEIKNTIHHARVYRIDGGKKTAFAMLRVFAVDLLHHRHEDLFSAPLTQNSISLRTAEPKLRDALAAGTATELGWLAVDDELLLDVSKLTSGHIGEFLSAFPGITRWKLAGFDSNSKLRLRPILVAAEGLADPVDDSIRKIVDYPGWRPATNVLFSQAKPVIVRRDALGRPRLSSSSGLPVSWSVRA